MRIIKDFLSLFFSITVLLSTYGIQMNFHYCENRLVNVGVFCHAAGCRVCHSDQSCSHSGEKDCQQPNHKKKCCHDDHEVTRLKNIENTISQTVLAKIFPVSFLTYFAPDLSVFNQINNNTTGLTSFHGPPPKRTARRIEFHSLLT